MSEQNLLWFEKYRPTKLLGIKSQEKIITILENLIDNGTLPNMLFYGLSGTGKTSTILSIAKKYYGENVNSMLMELNASENRGVNIIREKIQLFATTRSLHNINKPKLVILDECDSMTIHAQTSLRDIIDNYYENIRFCIICNSVNKIDISLQSRCMKFRFNPLLKDSSIDILTHIAFEEDLLIENNNVFEIITNITKGDMRKSINILQGLSFNFENQITKHNIYKYLNHPSDKDINYIYKKLINKDALSKTFNEINKYINEKCFLLQDIIYYLILKIKDKAKIKFIYNIY
jgi:replication factor C subunit 3/5